MSDDRLRTALRELGDVPPAPDLASAALRRMQRDRRQARIGLIVGVVAAVTATVAVPAALRGRPQAAAPAAPPVAESGWLSAYFAIDDPSRRDGPWVYDAAARGYRPADLSAGVVDPSPDGRQALVSGRGGFAVVPVARTQRPLSPSDYLPELAGNEWIWSPDSTKLLGSVYHGKLTEAPVFDVRTRALTRVPLQLGPAVRDRKGAWELGWTPDGGFVVTAIPAKTGPQERTEVDFLDPDGRITRSLQLTRADHFYLSPDGTMALLPFFPVVDNVLQPPQYQLLDLRTGDRRPAPARRWAYGHRLFGLDPPVDKQIDPRTGRPTTPTSVIVVDAQTGTTVHRFRLPVPDGRWVEDIRISPGAVPPGAIGL
jgi:hypothetical protein